MKPPNNFRSQKLQNKQKSYKLQKAKNSNYSKNFVKSSKKALFLLTLPKRQQILHF